MIDTSKKSITENIELFIPKDTKYHEVSLIDANDSFTHNLVQSFLKLGAPVRVFKAHVINMAQLESNIGSYLVLSPGPGIPNNAGIMKDVIQKYIGEIPMLGVCLGMQSINEIMGGSTIRAPFPVHGKTSLIEHNGTGIFTDIKSPTQVARYHSLVVDLVSDKLSIQSNLDGVIMAFHDTTMEFAAVQFHPESFLTVDGMEMLHNFLERIL